MNKLSKVYISLGSNMGNSISLINKAIEQIDEHVGDVIKVSSYYETAPWGFKADQNFINAMLLVETTMGPNQVLSELLQIEKIMGRIRKKSALYESRPIDLDIIAIGETVLKTKELVVPHPRMHERLFVLIPFIEIDPEWRHPLINKGLQELISSQDQNDIINRLSV